MCVSIRKYRQYVLQQIYDVTITIPHKMDINSSANAVNIFISLTYTDY